MRQDIVGLCHNAEEHLESSFVKRILFRFAGYNLIVEQ